MLAAKLSSMAVLSMVLGGLGWVTPLAAQEFQFEYAAKLICGFPNRPAVAPGRYYTAINIHNPNPKGTVFRRKFVLTEKTDSPAGPGTWALNKMPADGAVEIECGTREVLERQISKGFVVIQSPRQLDGVAVYTAGSVTDSLTTMDVERVPQREIIR